MANQVVKILSGPRGPKGPQGPQGIQGPTSFPHTGSAIISGSLTITGSLNVDSSASFSYLKVNGNISASSIFLDAETLYIDGLPYITSYPPMEGSDGQFTLGGYVTNEYLLDPPTYGTQFTGKFLDLYPSESIQLQTRTNPDNALFINYDLWHYPDHEGSGPNDKTRKSRLAGEWFSDGLTIREGGNTNEGSGRLVISGSTKTTIIDNGDITTDGSGSFDYLKVNGNISASNNIIGKRLFAERLNIVNNEVSLISNTDTLLAITGSVEVNSGLSAQDQLSDSDNVFKSGNTYFPKNREVDAMFFLGGGATVVASSLNPDLYGYPVGSLTSYPILFWDRKINNYFIKANLARPSFDENFCVYMPPIINAGYAAGERVQIYNMTSGSAEGGIYNYNLVHSGSIWVNSFSNQVNEVGVNPDTSQKIVTSVTNLNQGIYSGSWNNYKNVIYNGSNLDGINYSIEIPPGHKGVFEVFHYGTPSSYIDIDHPHPNNIAYQYGYNYVGYSSNYISGLSTEQSKVYRLISVEPL